MWLTKVEPLIFAKVSKFNVTFYKQKGETFREVKFLSKKGKKLHITNVLFQKHL